MDSLTDHRRIVRDLIHEYARIKPSVGDVRVEVIIDESIGHYELMHSGWTGRYRVHGSFIHIDVHDDKVWIQHDGTDHVLADRLIEAGIPQDQIVLAFRHPDHRPETGFALG